MGDIKQLFIELEDYLSRQYDDRGYEGSLILSGNYWNNIDQLSLTETQKKCVLEYLANKYWQMMKLFLPSAHYCKAYDPLMFSDNEAHSYVFDMEDGGRHHKYKNLQHVEQMITKEMHDYVIKLNKWAMIDKPKPYFDCYVNHKQPCTCDGLK